MNGLAKLTAFFLFANFAVNFDCATAKSTQAVDQKSLPSIPLGDEKQIAYDPSIWFYYAPEFMKDIAVGAFEAEGVKDLHAFLHSEKPSSGAPELQTICKQLKDVELDPKLPKSAEMEFVKINGMDACRISKKDADQFSIQYILVSFKSKNRSPTSEKAGDGRVYFTHYLYFYYPKSAKREADPLVAGLVNGIGNKK